MVVDAFRVVQTATLNYSRQVDAIKKLKSVLLRTGTHFTVTSGVQGASIREDTFRS